MAEQDIFSLLGEDDKSTADDMSDINPTLGVTQAASTSATPSQAAPPKQQQQPVAVTANVLTGKDPLMSQGVGAAVASQLTSVQVKQMTTPVNNPMWGSQTSKAQTIVLQQGAAKQTVSHHDYAQKQTVQTQLQQQKNIQQQLQLSQQQQQQIKQQLQQLQQKQLQIQQQQQLQQIQTVQPQQAGQQQIKIQQLQPGGFQQLQGGQRITLSGLQQKIIQQSPTKLTPPTPGSPQQTIIRLPVSLSQLQQQQSLNLTPSSTTQTITIQQPKTSVAGVVTAGGKLQPQVVTAGGTPRYIITRQAGTQGNQPVTLQLNMQDVNKLQQSIGKLQGGKLQTLPGGQVIRIQPAAQQQGAAVQTVLQQQQQNAAVQALLQQQQGAAVQTVLQQQQTQQAGVKTILQQQQGQQKTIIQQQQVQQPAVKTVLQQQPGATVQTLLQQQQGSAVKALLQQQLAAAVKASANKASPVRQASPARQVSPARQASPVRQASPIRQAAPQTQRVITLTPQQLQQLMQRSQGGAGGLSLSLPVLQQNTTQSPATSTGQVMRTVLLPQASTAATSTGQVVRTLVAPQSAASSVATTQIQSVNTAAGVATQNLNLLASQAAGATSATQILQKMIVPQSVAVSTVATSKPVLLTSQASTKPVFSQVGGKTMVVNQAGVNKSVVFSQAGGKSIMLNQATGKPVFLTNQPGGKPIFLTTQAGGKQVLITNPAGGQQTGGKQVLITNQAGGQQQVILSSPSSSQAKPMMLSPTQGKTVTITSSPQGTPSLVLSPTRTQQPAKAKTVTMPSQAVFQLPTGNTQGLTLSNISQTIPQTPPKTVISQTTISSPSKPQLTFSATSSIPPLAPISTTNTTVSTTQVVNKITPVVTVTTSASIPSATLITTQSVVSSPAVMSTATSQLTLAASQQSVTQSPTKIVTSTAAAGMPPLQLLGTAAASQSMTPISAAADSKAVTNATIATSVAAAQPALTSAVGTSSAAATPTAAVATPAATSVTVPKTTPSTQAPGGKITISSATAQMLAQKGIVLTRTPQGTFVAKIPQSMLLKAAAQGQLSQGAGKQAAGVSLLNKLQTTGAQAAKSGAGAKSPKAAQPTIVTTKGKKIKSPTRVSSPAASTSTASAPKIVYTIGGQQIAASSLTSGSTDQKQKMVLTLKPGMSAAEEVKKIGMELGKLQGQSKTPENLQKLKDLHGKLKQLQLSVQTSAAIAAKVKLDASSSKSSAEDTDVDLPKDERERKKIIKQRQLQDKANRIVAEAVAKAKASGLKDIPKIMINVKLPEVTEEELQLQQQKPKKEKSKKSKSSKPKSSKLKRPKSPKPPKPPKERKKVQSIIKKPKKLPLAALNKLKKQRKKLMPGLDESDSSEYDETPPPTPDPELDEFVEKRRSSRNTDKRKKYTVDYDFNITDDSSSSDDNNDPNKVKKPKEKKMKTERTQVISKESEDGENNLEIDVETVEPTMLAEQAKFFVDNPDESQANVVEKILSRRTVKKPQLPGEAQVGEVEEFFVKYKSYSYLHCEWCTQDKLLKGDQRIPQKIRRFRAKQHTAASYLQDLDDEPFNPDFLEVERVIDKAITEDPDNPGQMVTHFLIKWRSQPYEDATWEVPDDVDKEKVAIYERFSKIPPVSERKRVPRGRLTSWDKMEESRTYKNENTLREYQLEGVNWLVFSWFNGQNCILADEMGLGKTIQAITFLEEVKKTGIIGPFLVIAPLSTIGNWQREFDTWTDVNCVVYHGSSQSRHMIAEYEMYFKNDKGLIIPNIYKFQVLITTYEIVLADCQELSEIEWRVVIIDEAHRLKNRNCKLLEGLKILDLEHRVLLTGTPLQNNVEELFSLLNFLEPGQFRSSTQFMEDFGDLKSESQVEKLQGILRPMMLRRLKEDVEKNLAPKEETIVEVELTNIQKKYYRAILERNFNFLNKGTNSSANLPNLMNTMMELRKCCNHPFLINGAEEQIMMEFQNLPPEEMPYRHVKALVQSAGKMVLLDKLLPKLKEGGHKVLIFSQMIRCLDILEDYLITKQYAFERIDGRVRGNMRQAAIDRFSKPDSDRFVFLLCTRAGGLGINLTAADTCVIFDSDWNPQNDLQAQARCHRIGQKKSVKIYRLITRNSYEREMFDKASLKLGLDKAVLQSMRSGADKNEQGAPVQNLSKTEIEDLLKRGAYGAIMDDDDAASKFCEEDIDQILQRRTQIIKIEAGEKGSTFAKASFSLSGEKHASEIKLDDPDFWEKWAKRADLDVDQMKNKENMIIDAPRQRKQTRRYGNMDDMVQLSDEDSDFHSDDNDGKPGAEGGGGGGGGGGTKKGKGKGHKKQQQQQQALLQPEVPCKKQLQSGWTRLECFRVEKGLLTYGWGRWNDIISTTRFKRRLGEKDIEAISRTMLIYCLLHYKGDENIKSFIWDLVTPSPDGTVKDYKNHKGLSAPVPRGRKGRKPKKEEAVVPAILEYDFNNRDQDPETLLTDQGYKNHLKRHCNKVLLRVRLLYYLKQEVIGDAVEQIEQGVNASELPINMPAPEGEPPISWWDEAADRSLMVGVFKHGYERYIAMRSDPALCFLDRCGQPNQMEIARENNDDFNDSQLDVENVDGTDIQDDLKPSGSGMKDDLNDSLDMNEKEESLSSFPPSRTGSPAPNKPMQGLNANTDLNAIIPCEPGKLLFPQAPDLNTRLRRLVATFQRNHKRQQMKLAKKEKREHVKKIRFEEQLRQRELRKLEHAQKWSRREEADFYRILAAYGVEMDTQTGKYNWTSFKKLAKLEKKYDDRMQEYYEHFRVMCLKVLKKEDQIPEGWDTRAPPEFSIEGISEERANKCLHRIDLLLKIRNEVLPHPDRDRRLKKCRRSMELPEWWELGKHDRDLIIGTARYGINRTESQLSMLNDPDLSFQELKEKYPKWHLPASAFFPPAPPKVAKKEKTDKDTPASTSGAPAEGSEKLADGNTSENPETSVKTEAENNTTANTETKVDPDTGEGSNPVEMGDSESNGCDPDQGNASQSSSQLSIGGQINNESLSQDIPMSSQDVESLQGTQNSSQNHVSSAQSSQDIFMSSQEQNEDAINGDEDLKQEIKTESEDVKLEIKSETNDDESKERTSSDIEGGVPQRELCRPPDDTGNASNENQEAKQFQPEFNPAEFLRWPKDRVIVHRLEQLSHCVLKGEWPGRKRHHHPGDPNRNGGEGRGEGIMGLPEHNYAGDDGREDTKTILPKKKKRRKRAEIEQERAAQLAILLGQNPSLGLHPVFSSLMTSLPALAGAQLPANMAAAALSPMDLSSQNPTAAGTSQYHIQDAEFRPDDPTGMQAALLAAGNLAGMQQVMHKKKKKHKKLDPLADTLDPEAAERRRKRKLELVEKKRRRKKKQKDKAKEMSDAFNALKDDDHVPVMNPRTGERYIGQAAPMKKQLGGWMKEHEGFELLYPFHAVVSPDGTSVSFPPLPKEHEGFELLYPFHAVVSPDGTSVSFPPLPKPAKTEEPPKKKKKKSQRNPAKLDPAKLTGQEHVDVVDRNTGRRLPYKLTPTLSNLGKWLQLNPAYDVTSEWGSIVKEKGYIGEDLHNRVSLLSMKTSTAPVQANTAGASTSQAAILGSPASKLSMQIGQSSLGGLGSLGIAGFANQQQLGTNSAAVTNAAQQLVNMQAAALQDKQKAKTPSKKKKLKTSHPIASISKPVVVSSPPPVSGVPSLAGISPYLLPTQGGVFYSPFLASHNVQGLISATTTTTNSTNSMDNESQSSADSKLARTEESVDMEETVEINFADANVNTFAGVDLGDLDGELEENVISDIAMEEEVQ